MFIHTIAAKAEVEGKEPKKEETVVF